MNKAYWLSRWEKNQLGFHQPEINQHLQSHFKRLNLLPKSQVLVPLCGKSKDMLWLLAQGYQVLGIELSEIACRDFFKENNIPYQVTTKKNYTLFHTEHISLICGDFFALPKSVFEKVNGVYDRAALIALPKDKRTAYIQKQCEVLPKMSQVLLISYEYNETLMTPPPFSVGGDEIQQGYGKDFSIHLIETLVISLDAPLLIHKKKNVNNHSYLTEYIYHLSKKTLT